MGGGLLPVSVKNNKIYFLFGQENELAENKGWSDFGGGRKKGEKSFDTALREGEEELNGFFGVGNNLKTYVKLNEIIPIHYINYSSYLFKISYNKDLPFYFKNNYEFFSRQLPHIKRNDANGLLEKKQIKWFSFAELRKEKSKFRKYYQNTVDLILQNQPIIEKKLGIQKNKKDKTHKIQGEKINKKIKQTKKNENSLKHK